jgi:hypothetical protein
MADELSRILQSDQPRASLSPEKLEMMGKEAASLLTEKSVPLNRSIAKLASGHADINAEQVKRIVEFANTSAYLTFHDRNKTASAESSYPQFDLADAGTIMASLNKTSEAKVIRIDSNYGRAPEKQKVSNDKTEAALAELFLGKEKSAKVLDFSTDTVVDHIMSTKENLVSLKESLEGSASKLDMTSKQASEDYYGAIKDHLLEGGSFVDVIRGAHESGESGTKVASVMQPFIARLLMDKVAAPAKLHAQLNELEKVAHRVVDADHPFVAGYAAVSRLDAELDKVAMALEEVDASLVRINQAIREEFLATR